MRYTCDGAWWVRCVVVVAAVAGAVEASAQELPDRPEQGMVAVVADTVSLLIDGLYDQGLSTQTTTSLPVEEVVCWHCSNAWCGSVGFAYRASVNLVVWTAPTGDRGLHFLDDEALVSRCVGVDCADGELGSYALAQVGEVQYLQYHPVVLFDKADNFVEPGATFECDDGVERVVLVDTENWVGTGHTPGGFDW